MNSGALFQPWRGLHRGYATDYKCCHDRHARHHFRPRRQADRRHPQGRGRGPLRLRVAVTGGGCSGFQYNFALDEAQLDEDLVVERDGAKVLIDPVSLDFLAGAEIDFTDDLIGQAFKVNNPNATASCGCGTSFTI